MPKYQNARPYDIVRVIKDLQKAVKQLQVKSTNAQPFQTSPLLHGWTGILNYRITRDNEVQISMYEATPGTTTDGTLIASGLPVPQGPHQINCVPATARATLDTGGNLGIAGATGVTTLSIEVTIPLDV